MLIRESNDMSGLKKEALSYGRNIYDRMAQDRKLRIKNPRIELISIENYLGLNTLSSNLFGSKGT